MIKKILQIADNIQAQRDRIEFEQVNANLDAAIACLKVAALLIQNTQVSGAIWTLDETDGTDNEP